MDDFDGLDAVALAGLVRSGQVKPIELVEAAIARIEQRDQLINAVITRAFDHARELANTVDRSSPLAGVPFLIKDQLDWAGVRTAHGSAFRREHIAAADSEIVRRWLKAGVIPLGKTNVPECGLLATTEPVAYGATGNPWAPERTAGGSSGGSAAAVAAGLVPVASASDGGGSIRIPSAVCGVFGLKPTRGRTPGSAGWGGLTSVHVVSRSVRDSAAFLDAAAGPEPGDAFQLPTPATSFLEATSRPPGRLRVAVTTDAWEGGRYAPEVASAIRRTADLLVDLGHDVIEGRPPITPGDFATLMPALGVIVPAAIADSVGQWEALMGHSLDPALLEPLTWDFVQQGRAVSAVALLDAFDARRKLRALVKPFFDAHDVWLLPTVTEVAPRNGEWQFPAKEPRYGWFRMMSFVPPLSTSLANLTGQPAMSIPLANDGSTGLPIGSMFYGRFGEEATLLALAGQLEAARPWVGRLDELQLALSQNLRTPSTTRSKMSPEGLRS